MGGGFVVVPTDSLPFMLLYYANRVMLVCVVGISMEVLLLRSEKAFWGERPKVTEPFCSRATGTSENL